MNKNDFTKAMIDLFSLVGDCCGSDDIREDIISWFADTHVEEESYTFDENGMFYLLYDLANYDLICLGKNGKIDVRNSNHPDIAKLISPFVSPENVIKVRERLY